MGEHDDQWHFEDLDGVLQAPDDRLADHLSGVANHEQIAEPEVEDDLCGQTRVRAPEQRRDRVLLVREIMAPLDVLIRMPRLPVHEAAVAVEHLLPGRCGGEGRHEASAMALI
jgi:hypothetical protein